MVRIEHGIKRYIPLGDHASIKRVNKVLNSIGAMGVGRPDEIQAVVELEGHGLYRLKTIRFDNLDKSVHFITTVEDKIVVPDFIPEDEFGPVIKPLGED